MSAIFPVCKSLYSRTFSYCRNLTLVSFDSLQSINLNDAFASLPKLETAHFAACTSIYQNAFLDCSKLSDIYFPELITITPYSTISSYGTFRNTALTSVAFPKLQSLGANTFQSCAQLSVVSLPACTYIGSFAFRGCSTLASLYLLGSSVCTLQNSNAIQLTPLVDSSYTGAFGSVFVPSELVDTYKAANVWSVISDRITAYIE